MFKLKYGIFLTAFMWGVVNCSMLGGAKEGQEGIERQRERERLSLELFNEGNKLLDQANYSGAISKYQELLQKAPATGVETMTLFNMGVAYEAVGNCKGAGQSFRKAIKASSPEQSRLQAQSIYHLSKAYECVGNDIKVISSLIDLERRLDSLPPEVAYAELPARLAAAYARQGNLEAAKEHYRRAELGLAKISSARMKEHEKKELLAKTLFSMGSLQVDSMNQQRGLQVVKSIEFAQKYLLRSVELDNSQWSPRSAETILKAYDKLWLRLTQIESYDEALELAKSTLTNMEILKRSRFPEAINQEIMVALFNQLQKKEILFQGYLVKNSGSVKSTKEDRERFGIKRKVK